MGVGKVAPSFASRSLSHRREVIKDRTFWAFTAQSNHVFCDVFLSLNTANMAVVIYLCRSVCLCLCVCARELFYLEKDFRDCFMQQFSRKLCHGVVCEPNAHRSRSCLLLFQIVRQSKCWFEDTIFENISIVHLAEQRLIPNIFLRTSDRGRKY